MPVVEIIKGDLKAKIDTYGASLVSLSNNGFDLIEPNTRQGLYAGSVLAPWPNRIRDGKYTFNNENFVLPINEVVIINALHGLVAQVDWQITNSSESLVELDYLLNCPKIYPGKLHLKATYKLIYDYIDISIVAVNVGDKAAPYGVSIHTYLVAGQSTKNDQLFLHLPCSEFMQVDLERLLPLGIEKVDSTNFDFRNPKQISKLFIDHAFKVDPELSNSVSLLNQSKMGVELEFDENTKWIQIHTADRDGGADSRMAVAIEPMSCPPDAFNSGVDLISLAPKERHAYRLKIKQA